MGFMRMPDDFLRWRSCAKGGAVVIAYPIDDGDNIQRLRPWLHSLLREGNKESIARFDLDFMRLKVFAWRNAHDLEIQLQCWRLEEQRRNSIGREVKR